MNYRYRINYSKKNDMRYTSNLDIHKMWERTFRRAKLPLVYSQGFHPQPKIQLACPLPLGFLSRHELVDVVIGQDFSLELFTERIEKALPSGIGINQVTVVNLQDPALQTQIESSEYHIYFLENFDRDQLTKELTEVLAKPNIIRNRRGKNYDLRPLILEAEMIDGQPPYLRLILESKPSATGRPEEVLDEMKVPLELTRIIRNSLFFFRQ